MDLGLKGKIAMVGGASNGLGYAVAGALASEGASVSMASRDAAAIRLVVPSMKSRGGGSILIGTSSTVKEPIPNLALSNVLRSAVTSLAKTLSLELAGDNIRVNTLIPGRIATNRLVHLDDINAKQAGISLEEQQRRAAAAIPLGRYGRPDEFGRAAAFPLSDGASYIT